MNWLSKLPSIVAKSKTYMAGTALMLGGAGSVLADAAKIQELTQVFEFISSLPNHPGTQMFLTGLGIVGIGHKVEKAVKKASKRKPKRRS